jgi:hypothetical protein
MHQMEFDYATRAGTMCQRARRRGAVNDYREIALFRRLFIYIFPMRSMFVARRRAGLDCHGIVRHVTHPQSL